MAGSVVKSIGLSALLLDMSAGEEQEGVRTEHVAGGIQCHSDPHVRFLPQLLHSFPASPEAREVGKLVRALNDGMKSLFSQPLQSSVHGDGVWISTSELECASTGEPCFLFALVLHKPPALHSCPLLSERMLEGLACHMVQACELLGGAIGVCAMRFACPAELVCHTMHNCVHTPAAAVFDCAST